MATWTLAPCLAQLRAEFNRIAPGRDKNSDGSIGDQAHAARASDHNPDSRGIVHAIDVDRDLGGGLDMQDVVDHLVARCRSGAEKRLTYVIYNRRIWSASRDWKSRAYTGSNAHTQHAHFSATDIPAREASTASWHLEDLLALTEADKDWIRALFERTAQPDNGGVTSKIGRDALDQGIPNPLREGKTAAYILLGDIGRAVKAVAAEQGLSHEALLAAIGDVDDKVLAALADAGRSDEDLAAALRAALGDRAAAVGQLLADAQQP